jgi:hypothetical protein
MRVRIPCLPLERPDGEEENHTSVLTRSPGFESWSGHRGASTPGPGGEMDDRASLLTRCSGFESWPGRSQFGAVERGWIAGRAPCCVPMLPGRPRARRHDKIALAGLRSYCERFGLDVRTPAIDPADGGIPSRWTKPRSPGSYQTGASCQNCGWLQYGACERHESRPAVIPRLRCPRPSVTGRTSSSRRNASVARTWCRRIAGPICPQSGRRTGTLPRDRIPPEHNDPIAIENDVHVRPRHSGL